MKLFAGGFKGRADAVFLFFGEGRKDLTPVAQEVDAASRGGVRKILDLGFKGKRKECELLVLPGGRWKLAVMLGLGEPKKIDSECFREASRHRPEKDQPVFRGADRDQTDRAGRNHHDPGGGSPRDRGGLLAGDLPFRRVPQIRG